MPLISVTRLRLRSARFLPGFAWATWASTRQIRRSAGFLGGQVAVEGWRGFWTLTAWRDEAALRRYRDDDAHGRAMPRLLRWCDEASVAHWWQEGSDLPSLAVARQRMRERGRLSKVRHPSLDHLARQIAPGDGRDLPGLHIRPVDRV